MSYTDAFAALPSTVRDAITFVIERTRPTRVFLFGSRARGNARENSDFDIAVMGRRCSDPAWNRAQVDLSELPLTLRGVDLVEFEKLNETYRIHILMEGKLLYESADELPKNPR
jgi:predicted nucleotidyltransferase